MWQPGVTLEEAEKEIILDALKFYQFNRTQTAQALGIAVRTLSNKIAAYQKQGAVIPVSPYNNGMNGSGHSGHSNGGIPTP